MFILSLLQIFRKFTNTLQRHLAHNTNVILREARDNEIRFRSLKIHLPGL